MLADAFNNQKERQGKPDVRLNTRAVKRLSKDALKVKDVLSANKQQQVKVPELLDYTDLNTVITRADFEEQSAEYFSRVADPIKRILEKTGKTIADIDEVEIIGGGVRVPKV